ncbi:MAG: hypothetical protein ACD_79C00596G0002 [uncultured bacterium]|nr:MAG: hypothetical protein ACD_79C00596G0002 [uncultured bacterium]
MSNCPCGSEKEYTVCCEPLINGSRKALTAKELMCARYSAFAKGEVDFIMQTIIPQKQKDYDKNQVKDWSLHSEWQKLEIVETEKGQENDSEGIVEFIAHYKTKKDEVKHHEIAFFKKEKDIWYFFDGKYPKQEQFIRNDPKIGRNDPCVCGSGKKYKKCCSK